MGFCTLEPRWSGCCRTLSVSFGSCSCRRVVRCAGPWARRRARRARPSCGGRRRCRRRPGVDSCLALLAYEGAGRELVARLKYRNARSSLPFLARGMAGLAPAVGTPVDVVTWAPTTAARRRAAGLRPGRAAGPGRRPPPRASRLPAAPPPPAGRGPDRPAPRRPPGRARLPSPPARRRRGSSSSTTSSPAGPPSPPPPAPSGPPAPGRSTWWPPPARPRPPRADPWPGLHSGRVAVCGSVVESRRQSQAKRPT